MKPKTLLAFVVGAALGLAAGYLLATHRYETGPFEANRQRRYPQPPAASAPLADARPWAEPLTGEGLDNFYRVAPQLYRGAQPTAEGMKTLKAMGIRTVVNLRSLHSDRDEIGDTGLAYEHIHFNPLHAEEEDVVRFLQIVTDPARRPVFVHCQHGSDRTGTMCAIYRVAVCGWTKDEALEEMTKGGFGFHKSFENLLRFVRGLDVEAMKRRAAKGAD